MTTASRTSRGKAPIFSARQASQKRMVLYARSRSESRSWMVCTAAPRVKEGKATPRHRVSTRADRVNLRGHSGWQGHCSTELAPYECVMKLPSHCGFPPDRPLASDEAHH